MDLFDVYARFLGLRDELSCLGRMKIPAPEEVREEVDKLERVKHYLTGKPFINDLIRDRKTENAFEYQGDQYCVIMPGSSLDFCKEAFSQKNCLMDYIDEHAVGETTILFIRKNEKPAKSFVTMEVLDGNIEQVYAGGNTLPRKEVFMFICEYAKRKGFSVDLKKLITENYLYEGYHNYYEELEKFAEEAGI